MHVHDEERPRPRAPLIPAALAVLAGVLLARAGLEPAGGTSVGLALTAALAAWRWRGIAQLAALGALAALAAERAGPRAGPPVAPGERRMEACVETLEARERAWTGLAWARGDGADGPVRVRLVLAGADPPAPGERVRVWGRLRTAIPPQNPGEADPRVRDEDEGLAGVLVVDAWTRVGRCDGFALAAWMARGRRAFARLATEALPPPEAGLAVALVAGDADGVEPSDFDAFGATGTVHVLSVSGMHLALVTLVVFFSVRVLVVLAGERRTSAYDLRAAAALAALIAAAAYAGFAGMSLATARALVATTLVCAAALLGGASSAWNAWAAGIAALLLAGPPAVRTPTFALSFLAVAGILAASGGPQGPRFRVVGAGALAWLRATARWLAGQARIWPAQTARVTAGAAAATAPAVVAWFGRVPALGLIANAVAIPLFSAALVPLLAGAIVLPLSRGAARALVLAAWPALAVGRRLVAATARLPGCWLDVALQPAAAGALGVAVFACLLARGRLRLAVALAGTGIAAGVALTPARPPPEMEVTFLAVGQGDAAVVRFASGAVLLVDTGPEGAGRRVIVPFLRSRGVRRIDAIAISHAHPDHTGGLADVVRAFPVGELWLSGPRGADEGLDAARGPLAARRVPLVAVGAGTPPRPFGAARVEFLAGEASLRPEPGSERGRRNDRSLVLRVVAPSLTVLFTGDLERAGEEALLRAGVEVRADVVKVPHHGSATSSGAPLVRAVAPRVAVAGTGRDDPFGFPAEEVARRWRAAGAVFLDTAREGAVTVRGCATPGTPVPARVCGWSFVDPERGMRY